MRAVVFDGAGGNEVVRVMERPDPVPEGTQVLVAARFAGLNPADLLQRNGHYPAPAGAPADVPGLEVAGHVVAVGRDVTRWQPGERVMGLVAGGGLADRVLVDESNLVAVPDRLDDDAAAAVPEVFMTAHDALRTRCALTPGETVLVHGATGGVGTAALQLATAFGSRPIGVARTDEGREFVEAFGATSVDDVDFVAEVGQLVPGGVDVVLELVGAPHFPGNLEVLAPHGRIVVVGVGAGQRVEVPLLRLMAARASIHGTVLRSRSVADKAAVIDAFHREVLPSLADGTVRPVIDRVFAVDEVAAAFDHLESPGKRGKILLAFEG